jgi:aminopeptidase
MDPRVEKMAEVLITYSLGVQPGQWIVIAAPIAAEPLVRACAVAVTRAGAYVTTQFASDDIAEAVFASSSVEQLTWISPISRLIYEQADAYMGILAPNNTRTMTEADPRGMALASKAREPLMELLNARSARGDLHWTLAAYPTHAAAQDAGMSLRAYEEFVYGAGLLDEPDPPAAWRRLGERQHRLVDWFADKAMIRITGPGTELSLSVAGRTWISDEGKENFPGGEIFTGPVEDSVNGVIEFSFPAYLAGREVTGVRLRFENGVVTDARATGDQAFLDQALGMDEGARRLGEFAFGTNYGITRFTKNTLFDEKVGGTLHMALGRAYPETGGTNQSALHWDMVYDLRDGAEVHVDGELFSKNGEFTVLE